MHTSINLNGDFTKRACGQIQYPNSTKYDLICETIIAKMIINI